MGRIVFRYPAHWFECYFDAAKIIAMISSGVLPDFKSFAMAVSSVIPFALL